MTRSLVRRWRIIILATAAAVACTGSQDAPRVPLGAVLTTDSARAVESAHALIGPAAKAALDSGNSLFRKKAYDAALAQYRAAAALAPQHAAPLFGIYMVARATSNTAMADSALAGIRQRQGPMTPAPHAIADSTLQRVHQNPGKKSPAG